MLAQYTLYGLAAYIIISATLTLFKKYTTINGLFITFISVLGLILLLLISTFDEFIFKQHILNLELAIVKLDWKMLEISLHIKIDMLSYLFTLLVITIGFCTNIYILNYFKYEAKETTFYIYINWFIISMLIFVLAENSFTLFLGWELIGLTSFLLINYWSERRGVLKSAFKAFSFNKVSDALLLNFLIVLWYTLNHTQFSLLENEFTINSNNYSLLLLMSTVGLILCAGIKSAQLFMHVWLPDSMEAPVPASALIHSATLVSAGIYLLLRFSIIINYFGLSEFILIWGSITSLYGGVVAAAQTDVKKLLAYSTISHCGFLFVCTGLNWVWLTIVYLFLHGLFKAASFFCVGSFIRINKNQDSRTMGINNRLAPLETVLLLICIINLGGLPLTIGFFYKKMFLALLFFNNTMYFVLACCLCGMLTSIIYTYRLFYYINFDINKQQHVNLLIKILQANDKKINNFWSLSTIAHVIAVLTMLLVTFLLYELLVTLVLTLNISLEQSGLKWNNTSYLIENIENLYDGYYYIFYNCYVLIIFIICCVDWRYSYTTEQKFWFIIYFVGLVVFGYIIISLENIIINVSYSVYNYVIQHITNR